ncbi:MAG: sigma-54-dependent transcriptional regulator [Planctomycetota bacterium]
MASVLVVDDEQVMRAFLEKALSRFGHKVTAVPTAEAALEVFAPRRFDLVLSDLRMPGQSGFELLDRVVALEPETPVVIMTAFGSISAAVEAVQRGAADFVTKPIELTHLELVVQRALEKRAAQRELLDLRPHADERESLGELVGRSLAMKKVYALLDKVASTDLTVLILGETGTGKGLCAKAIHRLSPRARRRLQVVNCSALQDTLLESELFGHEKGAFTGAHERKIGHFEVADGGTLFLDEVGDAPSSVQAKLLRAIQDKEIIRVGGTDPIKVDVRVVAATHRDLESMVSVGEFREDLYYRLSPFPIRLPALRERAEDIPLLVEHILMDAGQGEAELAPEAALALERCDWKGNVRQLENAITRACVLAGGGTIELEHLADSLGGVAQGVAGPAEGLPLSPQVLDLTLREARIHFDRFYVERLLRLTRGNVSEAARRAGLGRASLHDKINKLGLDPDRYRDV